MGEGEWEGETRGIERRFGEGGAVWGSGASLPTASSLSAYK